MTLYALYRIYRSKILTKNSSSEINLVTFMLKWSFSLIHIYIARGLSNLVRFGLNKVFLTKNVQRVLVSTHRPLEDFEGQHQCFSLS